MINFLKYQWLYFLISALVIGSGLVSIITWGYRYSIDFAGGTNLEYLTNKSIPVTDLNKVLENLKIKTESVQSNNKDITIQTTPISGQQESQLRNSLQKTFSVELTTLRYETVGPTLGSETLQKTLIAAILGIAGILIYMSFAFKGFNYAFAAILAMIHDFLVVIGTYSLLSHFLGAELDTMFVTALLTTMAFSVHDTIIIFDKIREYFRTEGKADMEFYASKALVETMVRSLNNSMTIIFMLLALTLLGGVTIRFFVATLLVGTITGTYSSPFVATPILVWLEKRKK